jgi:CRISPR-associated protein Csm3
MQLIDIKEIKGAGDTEMHIGGTDNPVIKHPHTQEPYIPGSSLKGKVRSLLEMKSGLMVRTNGRPVQAALLKKLSGDEREECEKILKLFGSSGAEGEEIAKIGPTRVSFSDCLLSDAWRKKAREERLSHFEVKSENSINRILGTAENPRLTERVPAGVTFDFSVSLKMLGEEEELFQYLMTGLKLLEMDALGGSGSRGYGKITFLFDDDENKRKFEDINPFPNGG